MAYFFQHPKGVISHWSVVICHKIKLGGHLIAMTLGLHDTGQRDSSMVSCYWPLVSYHGSAGSSSMCYAMLYDNYDILSAVDIHWSIVIDQ